MTLDAFFRETYAGKRVFVTGHTGFKGSWLVTWLASLGADVTGFALAPDTTPAMFDALRLERFCQHRVGDVRDPLALGQALAEADPDVVFHLAAQPLVRLSYQIPVETLATNVMGTAHLLEAVRAQATKNPRRRAVVVVTSDKCYENREWPWGYRENEPMGGHDVYSMSKGATELVTSSWRRSFFPTSSLTEHGVALASARAGNVVGGGDWAADRLVPDIIRHLQRGERVPVRNPRAVRPWQHVVEPLSGYLTLGARLLGHGLEHGQTVADHCDGWNFGPPANENHPVGDVAQALVDAWGKGRWEDESDPDAVHEAGLLRLSIEKATTRLGWHPRWDFSETIRRTADWYRAHEDGVDGEGLLALTRRQIADYERAPDTIGSPHERVREKSA